jgi:hypothetical protein
MNVLVYTLGADREVVRVAKGNRGPTTIFFAKHPEMTSGPRSAKTTEDDAKRRTSSPQAIN